MANVSNERQRGFGAREGWHRVVGTLGWTFAGYYKLGLSSSSRRFSTQSLCINCEDSKAVHRSLPPPS